MRKIELACLIVLMIILMNLPVIWKAFAQDDLVMPQIPDEATKIRALKRAYELNGNSMVGDGRMIDVSKEDLSDAGQARLPPTDPLPKKGRKP